MLIPRFEFYELALEFGHDDPDAWGETISHAQVVNWWVWRNERTRRANVLAEKHATYPPYR